MIPIACLLNTGIKQVSWLATTAPFVGTGFKFVAARLYHRLSGAIALGLFLCTFLYRLEWWCWVVAWSMISGRSEQVSKLKNVVLAMHTLLMCPLWSEYCQWIRIHQTGMRQTWRKELCWIYQANNLVSAVWYCEASWLISKFEVWGILKADFEKACLWGDAFHTFWGTGMGIMSSQCKSVATFQRLGEGDRGLFKLIFSMQRL